MTKTENISVYVFGGFLAVALPLTIILSRFIFG